MEPFHDKSMHSLPVKTEIPPGQPPLLTSFNLNDFHDDPSFQIVTLEASIYKSGDINVQSISSPQNKFFISAPHSPHPLYLICAPVLVSSTTTHPQAPSQPPCSLHSLSFLIPMVLPQQHPTLIAVVQTSIILCHCAADSTGLPPSTLPSPSATWHTMIFPASKSGIVFSYLRGEKNKALRLE